MADEVRKLAERTQKSLGEIEANADVLVQSISEMNESIRGQSEAKFSQSRYISGAVTAEVDYMAKAIAQDVRKNKF